MTPLEDIPDLHGWVRWQVGRFAAKGRPVDESEFEEYVQQGVVILLELHKAWDPKRSAKFSAYAISLFQRRMIDWYRHEVTSACRGHIPRVEGKREPIQYHEMMSLDTPGESGEPVAAFAQDRALTHWDAAS